MEAKSNWMGIRPQCCDPGGRWAHLSLQSIKNYWISRQTLMLTKDLELMYHCDTKDTGTDTNSICQNNAEPAKFPWNWYMSSKMEGKSDWMGIMPQCCDPAGRWANVTLQSIENYWISCQTSMLTNQGSRTNVPLSYQKHGDRNELNLSE